MMQPKTLMMIKSQCISKPSLPSLSRKLSTKSSMVLSKQLIKKTKVVLTRNGPFLLMIRVATIRRMQMTRVMSVRPDKQILYKIDAATMMLITKIVTVMLIMIMILLKIIIIIITIQILTMAIIIQIKR